MPYTHSPLPPVTLRPSRGGGGSGGFLLFPVPRPGPQVVSGCVTGDIVCSFPPYPYPDVSVYPSAPPTPQRQLNLDPPFPLGSPPEGRLFTPAVVLHICAVLMRSTQHPPKTSNNEGAKSPSSLHVHEDATSVYHQLQVRGYVLHPPPSGKERI